MKKKSKKSTSTKSGPASAQRILESVLAQVPFEGWTEAAYAAALKQINVTRDEVDQLFPDGIRDIVEAFGAMIDETMQKRISAERGFAKFRVRDKVTFAVRARLEALGPYREATRRLMMWSTLPTHMPMALKRLYKTVDLIWIAAGDTATDYNFYTKRILLAGVLKTTMLYWLSDESAGHQATWDFLDRRIADVMKLGKSISLMKEFKPSEIVEMVREKIKQAL